MRSYRVVLLLASAAILAGQDVRPKDVREIAKAGSSAIPQLQDLLKNPDAGVRIEAVRQITEIGTAASLDALILATRDRDPEVQIHATSGLVNFYLPGYVKTGIGAPLRRAGSSNQGQIHRHQRPGDRPLCHGEAGGNRRARQTGQRRREHGSAGQRRARPRHPARRESHSRPGGSPPFQETATRSTNRWWLCRRSRDESAGPRVTFLVHDLDPKVQIAAIETTGLLRAKDALPELADALKRTRDAKVKRAALARHRHAALGG